MSGTYDKDRPDPRPASDDASDENVEVRKVYRSTAGTRMMADEIRKRSAQIRDEAERIRSLSMITLINVEINYRTALKAHDSVMKGAKEKGPQDSS